MDEFWIDAGGEICPAAKISTSQIPVVAATAVSAFSSVISAAWTEELHSRVAWVSRSVVSLRPIRMILWAPALANDWAVARPIPLP